ncbi:pseudouridine synthase [Enterocloster citroniae]|uniref:pseudouridine synthase n=1 Tax=Enterocloster citroniae TaxID=358743 RepID=UPI00189B4A8B|nr:pseudouridine synthase [Enterocloster citroniae]
MADKNRQKSGVMRLDKFLGEMGHGTRSQIKDMAKRGRIQVNGQVAKATDLKICPDADQVTVDGALVGYAKMEYYMLNKPQGVVSARTDNHYETVVGLIGDALRQDLFPVGRLDVDTEGLLLITNDGEMAHNLLSPKKHVDKVYMARLSGTLPKDAAKRLEEGILLEDGTRTLPAKFEYAGEDKGQEVLLTIREGKFHQVKRMFEALGCQVVYLKRLSMGPLRLDPDLEPGEYRPLSEEEIRSLMDCRNQKKSD